MSAPADASAPNGQATGTIAVSSQLAQAYRQYDPLTAPGGSVISAAYDAKAGQTDLFVQYNGDIHRVRRTADAVGWTATDLAYPSPAYAVSMVTAGDTDGSIVVMAADSQPFSNKGAQSARMLRLDDDGTSTWQQIPQIGAVTGPTSLVALAQARDVADHPIPVAFLLVPPLPPMRGLPTSGVLTMTSAAWQGSQLDPPLVSVDLRGMPDNVSDVVFAAGRFKYGSRDGSNALGPFYPGVVCSTNTGGQWGVTVAAMDAGQVPQAPSTLGSTSLTGQRFAAFCPIHAAPAKVTDVSQITDLLLAVGHDDGVLYRLDYTIPTPGSSVRPPMVVHKLTDGHTRITAVVGRPVAAALAPTGSLGAVDVVVLGADQRLYQLLPATTANPVAPYELVPLSSQTFASVVAGADPDLAVEVFGITPTGNVVRIWRTTHDEPLNLDPVVVGRLTDAPQTIEAYCTQITVYDHRGVPAHDVAVTIASPEGADIDVNGDVQVIDADHPWTGTTNAVGQVCLNVVSQTLGVPVLTVTTALTPAVEVDAAGNIRDYLSGITADDLTRALVTHDDGTTSPLVPPQADKDKQQQSVQQVASGIVAAMSIAPHTVTQNRAAGAAFLHPSNDARVAGPAPGSGEASGARPDPASLVRRQFRLEFTGDGVRHTDLTPEAADALFEDASLLQALSDLWGALSWWDFWDTVKTGLAQAVDVVAKTVGDTIQALVTVVVDGVSYAYNAVIGAVNDLLALVEQILSSIGALWDSVFRWLGTIFDWNAIVLTKDLITTSIDQVFVVVTRLSAVAQSYVDKTLTGWSQQLHQNVEYVITNYLGGDTVTLDQFRTSRPAPDPGTVAHLRNATGANFAQQAMVNALGGPVPSGVELPVGTVLAAGAVGAPALPPGLADAWTKITDVAGQFQAGDSVTQALADFEAVFSDPENVIDHALASVLRLLEAVAQAALAGADALVTALHEALTLVMAAIQKALHAELDIPLLSSLYQAKTGSPLTIIDAFALALAVPANAIHTLLTGQPLVPDQATLTRMTSLTTADALLQRTGLDLTPAGSAAASASLVSPLPATFARAGAAAADAPPAPLVLEGDSPDWIRLQQAFSVISVTNTFFAGALDVLIDLTPPLPTIQGPSQKLTAWGGVLSMCALGTSAAGALFGCPWWYAAGPPGVGNADQFGKVLWIYELVPFALDIVWAGISTLRGDGPLVARFDFTIGTVVAWALGVVDLALTITWTVFSLSEKAPDLAGVAGALLGAFPGALKILHAAPVAEASELTSWAALLIVDVLCNAGAVVLAAVSTKVSWPAFPEGPAGEPKGDIVPTSSDGQTVSRPQLTGVRLVALPAPTLAPARSRRHHGPYPADFRVRVLALYAAGGRSVAAVAGEAGIAPSTLRRWLRRAAAA